MKISNFAAQSDSQSLSDDAEQFLRSPTTISRSTNEGKMKKSYYSAADHPHKDAQIGRSSLM
ncbi:unnamed protein product [Amoebophrya sp. A25]|nr:unnamed protein product [Amoebophrya sp. A25]|eukprot:GSA25T00001864001.1